MEMNSMSMITSMQDGSTSCDMAEKMHCNQMDEMSCNMLQCVCSCTVSIAPLLLPAEHFSFFAIGKFQFHYGLANFLSIIHPVNTPPPLV